MSDIAGWIAPIATMIAAMMTAANLGARVTGWGFVVFTIGSLCWSVVGLSTIWRWLGRQRAYEIGGKAAQDASRRSAVPTPASPA